MPRPGWSRTRSSARSSCVCDGIDLEAIADIDRWAHGGRARRRRGPEFHQHRSPVPPANSGQASGAAMITSRKQSQREVSLSVTSLKTRKAALPIEDSALSVCVSRIECQGPPGRVDGMTQRLFDLAGTRSPPRILGDLAQGFAQRQVGERILGVLRDDLTGEFFQPGGDVPSPVEPVGSATQGSLSALGHDQRPGDLRKRCGIRPDCRGNETCGIP
jgi:hypothetical protein